MNRRDFCRLFMAGTAGLFSSGCTGSSRTSQLHDDSGLENEKPNIILIMSDDIGFSDIGCFGSEIPTPNIDMLAAKGLRFTQFYNAARCCPSRASILTGLYPHQAGVGHMVYTDDGPGYRGQLNENCVTIAEVLRQAGYRNYMTGKWHVCKAPYGQIPTEKHNWPLQRGFNKYYGSLAGSGSFYDVAFLTRDNDLITPQNDPKYKPEKPWYYTDAISDNAIMYIDEHCKDHSAEPFFMYVTYTAAHWPLHAPQDRIDKFKGKYNAGYDAIRKARFERLKKLGIINPDWKLTERAGQNSQMPDKEWEARCMEVYAAQIEIMDEGIGRLISKLEESGKLNNTIIMYLQDNGGCAEMINRDFKQKKYYAKPAQPPLEPMGSDELQLKSTPKKTRDGYPVVVDKPSMPGGPDTYFSYGINWANVSNTPFREYKHWVHEGGISTPFIVCCPSKIKAAGNLRHTPAHLIDVMATCIDAAGATYPAEYNGNTITPLEGKSLLSLIKADILDRDAIYWEHEGNRAVRAGKWKLVAKAGEPWELYDMENDRTETNNLAGVHRQKVEEMAAMWEKYARRANVLTKGAYKTLLKQYPLGKLTGDPKENLCR